MLVDFRNANTLWASILAETLKRLGLKVAVICPGSRSTPLAIAFAKLPEVEAIPVLDERSAAFFALGIAKASKLPVVLICTSGTAGANFYPAAIEARESRVPLLILTADRPPEMRDCHSGQTIDQVKLYGNYPNWQAELALPSIDMGMLGYLRQTAIHAWERSLYPVPGVVHLNIPFRDPLAPIAQPHTSPLSVQFQSEDFFAGIVPPTFPHPHSLCPTSLTQEWQQYSRGIILAGTASPKYAADYCSAIAKLSQTLKYPVLAEGLSPLRNYSQLNSYLISTYDIILRNQNLAQQLAPEIAIQVGDIPTSKELRTWLESVGVRRWVIDPSTHNLDPLHGKTTHLRLSIEQLASAFPNIILSASATTSNVILSGSATTSNVILSASEESPYLQMWREAEAKVRQAIDDTMATTNQMFEGKAAWLLSQTLPPGTPVFIANSMPVRDVEFFWAPNNSGIQPFFNRGANGIDGTLSTALGIAHRHQSSVMLTGDLALLHDTNGFLLRNKFVGHLTIVLINNNGGGIFEMLPISQFEPPFEEFFATPQDINFAQMCVTYGIEHEVITDWQQLKQRLNPLPKSGIRVLELQTNRKADARWRQDNLRRLALGSITCESTP